MNISSLIKLTDSGLETASDSEILTAIQESYKKAYGEATDLSMNTADGIFIHDLLLAFRNVVSTVQQLYLNLDVKTAQGKNLDKLARFLKKERKTATSSTATVVLTNGGSYQEQHSELKLLDRAGVIWTVKNVDIAAGQSQTLTAVCDTVGQITADVGWIYTTVEPSYIAVNQTVMAVPGVLEESDFDFRNRLLSEDISVGIIENIASKITGLSGVRTVKVITNNTGSAVTAADGTSIPAGSNYIVVQTNGQVDDAQIADAIHDNIVPGMRTVASNGQYGIAKSKQYLNTYGTQTVASDTVYWKQAALSAPEYRIYANIGTHFNEQAMRNLMKNGLAYLNGCDINNPLKDSEFLANVQSQVDKEGGQYIYNIESYGDGSPANHLEGYNYTRCRLMMSDGTAKVINTSVTVNFDRTDIGSDEPDELSIYLISYGSIVLQLSNGFPLLTDKGSVDSSLSVDGIHFEPTAFMLVFD